METEQKGTVQGAAESEGMIANYKQALERAIARLPVKNGVVDIDSIWIETSLPLELLREILKRSDLELPENVERINTKSRAQGGSRRGKSRRR